MEDSYCLGNGIAKACAEKSGPRLKLSDHMIQHWDRIGFQPSEFKIEDDLDNIIDVEIRESSSFSPATKQIAPDNEEQSRFTGVVVKNLPEAIPGKDVLDILETAGLTDTPDYKIKRNNGKASIEVNNLDSKLCIEVIDNLNKATVHGNRIYCRGLSNLHSPVSKPQTSLPDKPNHTPMTQLPAVSAPAIKTTPTTEDSTAKSPLFPPLNPFPKTPLLKITPIHNNHLNSQIPGLPPAPLTKSQKKKLRKFRAKADHNNSLDDSDFEFTYESCAEDLENSKRKSKSVQDLVATIETIGVPINKRPYSPEEEKNSRRTKKKEA